ncbi:SPOR domain-containing protein [Desulfospira joergensenii]|uniref:SPOR domain-containing protein n=1 Tax=Desulfospira joergensenii TaxID=53329 RepID=UPI0003B5DC91|nr:tetratricopeptide repeat protein [Desulfospira joergensenii]
MKKHLIWAVFLLFIAVHPPAGFVHAREEAGKASAPDLSEKEWFDRGVLFLKQEKYPEAVKAFTSLIEISPRAADAYKNRGVAYMKQNLYDLAIQDFLKTIEIQPDLKGLYSNLGVAWYYQKEYRKAIENYDKEIQQAPNSYFTYFNRAICWAELKENQKSLNDIKRTLEIMPDLYPALCLKGDLLAKMNQPVQAKEIYEKAISLHPDQTYARNKLAELKFDSTLENIVTTNGSENKKTGTGPRDRDGTSKGKANDGIDPSTGKKKVYELQVGAFRILENARDMQNELGRSGIPSRLMTIAPEGARKWYFVRTGNYPSYAKAREAETEFEKKTGRDVIVKLSTRW